MGLADALKAEVESSRPGLRCSVARALDALEPEDRKALEEALAMPPSKMPHAVISRVVGPQVGFRVPADQVSKHRSGSCCGTR